MKYLLLLLGLLCVSTVQAQGTFNVKSCAYQDVNAAINNTAPLTAGSPQHLAVNGDVIVLPVCTNTSISGSCPSNSNTWGCANTSANDQVLTISVGLTLKGQDSPGGNQGGTRQTVIIDNNQKTSPPHGVIILSPTSPTSAPRITGITFWTATNDSGANTSHIPVTGGSHAFRIDHNEFDADEYAGGTCDSRASQGITFGGDVWGVVDHNLFQFCRLKGIFGFGKGWGGDTGCGGNGCGDINWANAESMGMPGFPANQFNSATGTCGGVGSVPCQAALIFEDNTFNQDVNNSGSNSFACEQSGRCVSRFNSYTSNGTHGYEQNQQGQRQWEQYGNTLSSSKTLSQSSHCQGGVPSGCNNIPALDVRSGLAMLFENQIVATGVYTYGPNMVTMEYFRCNNCTSDPGAQAAPWGEQCNGSAAFSNNASWDFPNASPLACIGNIGYGQESVTINRNGCAPALTSACTAAAWPNNKLLGNYAWKNNNNGTVDAAITTSSSGGSPLQIIANLDYYNGQTAGCTGTQTTGVCVGTFASIPTGCSISATSQDGQTTGVGYWATDKGNWNQSGKTFWDGTSQGVLYKCMTTAQKNALPTLPAGFSCQAAGANWWCPWYEPFTYPHPLVATQPAISITPNPVAFGNQQQGTSSPPLTVTVTNPGSAALVLSTPFFTISGTNASEFVASAGTCSNGASVAVGASCTFTMVFSPIDPGPDSAILTVNGNASGTVNITGSGTISAGISFNPTSVSFGGVVLGSPSPTQNITISSTGTANLNISSITFSCVSCIPGPWFFAAAGTSCNLSGLSLAPGASCVIVAQMIPGAITGTVVTGNITVVDNASGSPHVFVLTGFGTPQNAPTPTLSINGVQKTLPASFTISCPTDVKVE